MDNPLYRLVEGTVLLETGPLLLMSRGDFLCDGLSRFVALSKAGLQEVTQCRQQTPGGLLFSFSRLVALGFEQDVHRLGVTSDRFDINSESDHESK